MKTIIGIDPGTHCGWSVRSENAAGGIAWNSGVWDLAPRRHEGGGMRFVRLRSCLRQLLDAFPGVTVLAYEEVRRHLGTDAAHIYGGVVAALTEECESRKIPYTAIPVGTVKKVATGKGNADKAAMVAAANREWPAAEFEDDNEADARWIAETCARQLTE